MQGSISSFRNQSGFAVRFLEILRYVLCRAVLMRRALAGKYGVQIKRIT